MNPRYPDHRRHFDRVLKAVLEAADPYRLVTEALQIKPDRISVHDEHIPLAPGGRIVLIAVGKAASPMARAAHKAITASLESVIISRPEPDHSQLPAEWQIFQAGHPLPNQASLAAGIAVQSALQERHAQDLVLLLLSGGGSALLELTKVGISIEDLRAVNMDLLRSGAPIEEINLVRKSMSRIKAGGLAHMASPADVLGLVLSDVVGDDLGVIASGPTVFESVDPTRAAAILEKYGLWKSYPDRFQDALLSSSDVQEAKKHPKNILLADNQTVQIAAAETAARMGFLVSLKEEPLSGEARAAGASFAGQLFELAATHPNENVCLIQGGETTVTVQGDGQGGRNQEFAVGAAQVIHKQSRMAVMSFATDGIDGPTDAAGAVINSGIIELARSNRLDVQAHLDRNDVYPMLARLGALIRTGPTWTNLNDIAVGCRYLSS